MCETSHISSLLLRADPNLLKSVQSEIVNLSGASVAVADPSGKIIVTLETDSETEIVAQMNTLSLIDGVVSAALVYHEAFHEGAT